MQDTHNGELMGTSSPRLRAFFRSVTDWHRYVALAGDSRPLGKSITGASNLIFLFIVVSGAFIWWRAAVGWFKKGLRSKALYFNWHNVFGVWTMVPLFLVVLSATVISYLWASNLRFRPEPWPPHALLAPLYPHRRVLRLHRTDHRRPRVLCRPHAGLDRLRAFPASLLCLVEAARKANFSYY
jgi:uncharacterized iron-regulated membrane protein